MKSSRSNIFSNIKKYARQAIGSVLLTFLLWQGMSISPGERYANGSNLAFAANPIADSPAEIVEKVKDRVTGGKAAAIEDEPQLSRTEQPRLPNERAGQADKTEQYPGDTPDVVQKTADRNVEKAEDFSRKTTAKVKNFFGF